MGQMSLRTLLTILSVCTLALGCVGLSETIHPSKTALDASSLTIRLFAPVLLVVGAALFVYRRRFPRKVKPSPRALAAIGGLCVAAPLVIWLAGAVGAPEDGAIWAPIVAVASVLLALPGFGMLFGGIRRLGEAPAPPRPPVQSGKVKRKR